MGIVKKEKEITPENGPERKNPSARRESLRGHFTDREHAFFLMD